jgi:hypothetical protein
MTPKDAQILLAEYYLLDNKRVKLIEKMTSKNEREILTKVQDINNLRKRLFDNLSFNIDVITSIREHA